MVLNLRDVVLTIALLTALRVLIIGLAGIPGEAKY
jgi:hypothetical protein